MLCSNCKKREVEVLIKQVINQEVHNLNLCRACAEEMGFISPEIPSITISFSMNEIGTQPRSNNVRNDLKEPKERVYDALVCSSCGMEYAQFRAKGLLGCSACYNAFRFPLGAYLQKEQGAESHWGGNSEIFSDIQVAADTKKQVSVKRIKSEQDAALERLKTEMSEAISCEQYERAAEIRDMISKIHPDGSE